jgi:EAL domain-containing protein (putative c-di-GMP-specific phosphodiesterase class I)/GGDEF domain-containing protein
LLGFDGAAAVRELVGQSGGDLLLAQAGRRLRAASPPETTVARWGRDEFAVLVSDVGSEEELVDLAERLAAEIATEPFDVAGEHITITVSAGVAAAALSAAAGATAGDSPGATAGDGAGDGEAGIDDVLGGAQAAMSRAREAGGGQVAAFASEMHAAARRRAELAAALREAIAHERLELRYQPIVELATSTVAGVEALVRWNQAGQQLSPGEFLAVADENGLTAELGGWVLREASRQVAAWREAGWDLGLSVNVSARQAGAPRFATWLAGLLADVGLPPQALTVEVTEDLLADGASPVAGELAGLRANGVRLAIDDFGTGNFSLTHLRQLAVDVIKIDPSFIAGLGTDPTVSLLTKAIVQLGSDLGIEVIAEGIERPEQLDHLLAMGCGLGQGFALAVPMSPAEMELMLAGQRRGKIARRRVRDQADDQPCSQAS